MKGVMSPRLKVMSQEVGESLGGVKIGAMSQCSKVVSQIG